MKKSKTHPLKQVIEELGTSVMRFEKEVGAGTSSLSAVIRRNSAISDEVVAKITTRYPFISKKFLETGEGEVFLPTGRRTPERSERSDMPERTDWKEDKDFKMPTAQELQGFGGTGNLQEKDVVYGAVMRMHKVMLETPMVVILSNFDLSLSNMKSTMINYNARLTRIERELNIVY